MRYYKIVTGDAEYTSRNVSRWLNDGYELSGQLVVTANGKYPQYSQALVLTETYPGSDDA